MVGDWLSAEAVLRHFFDKCLLAISKQTEPDCLAVNSRREASGIH